MLFAGSEPTTAYKNGCTGLPAITTGGCHANMEVSSGFSGQGLGNLGGGGGGGCFLVGWGGVWGGGGGLAPDSFRRPK